MSDIFNSYEKDFVAALKEIDELIFNIQTQPQKCFFFLTILFLILIKKMMFPQSMKKFNMQIDRFFM